MFKYTLLFIGLCFFSIVTGLMIGLSESPVVGVFVTSLFGLLIALIGIFQLKSNGTFRFLSDISLNKFGFGLISFSSGLAFGMFFGIFIRTGYFEYSFNAKVKAEFVWQNETAPESVFEALDWIVIQQLLLDRGYSGDQVKEIYRLREKGDYDEDTPYSLMLKVFDEKDKAAIKERETIRLKLNSKRR